MKSRKKKNKTFQLGTGIAAVGALSYCTLSRLLTYKLVSVALDRKMPKSSPSSRRWLSGCSNCEELLDTYEQAAACLKEGDCETVQIICKDGERLVGHLHCCNKPKRMIIAMHGWRSSWNRDFGLIDAFWCTAGCCVLYAEQRGQNNSGGKYMGFGLTERYDCVEWIRWVQKRYGKKIPIYLAGISMGASTVLMAGGLELPAQVHGIIADCGFTSPYHIWQHVVKRNLHLSYKVRARMADRLCRKRIRMGPEDYSTVEAMKSVKVPVLFIHGAEDHFVPISMTYENYTACVAPKQLLIVPGADHGMSYLVDPKAYEKAMVAFWKEFD
ncbi:MAG: alpha/beta hydrolase [Clostridia bacterium]|nr:alpha/beta hydrolase [Clostridia bacterium]